MRSNRFQRFQIQAIKKQFPRLFQWAEGVYPNRDRPLIREDLVESIRVAVTTVALMAERPSRRRSDGNLCSIDDDRSFFLLDREMSVLAEVGQDSECWTPGGSSSRAGETVGEAVAGLSDPAVVAFILERHTGWHVENSCSVGGYDVTLYKTPRDWAIPDWIAEQRRRAEEQLAAQLAAIESQPGHCAEIRLTAEQSAKYRASPCPGPATSFAASCWRIAEDLSELVDRQSVYLVDDRGETLASIESDASGTLSVFRGAQ